MCCLGWESFCTLTRTKKKWRVPTCASVMQGMPMGTVLSSITFVTGLRANHPSLSFCMMSKLPELNDA